MRKWISIGLSAAAITLIGFVVRFFTATPGWIDRSQNRVVPVQLSITSAARQLHATLDVADMHADSLLWKRGLLERSDRGHIDVPRLIEGRYALQVFSSVTKSPKDKTMTPTGRIPTLLDASSLQTYSRSKPGTPWSKGRSGMLKNCRTTPSEKAGAAMVGGMLSIEGLHDLEGEVANLDVLYAAGFRMAGLAHFFDNDVAGSMHGVSKGGLTTLGRQVVRRMETLGMIVDLAHSSHATVADVLAMATRPVVFSHGGVRAICNVNRNLTDDEVKGIANAGGLIGMGYWQGAICSTSPRDVARSIAHVRDLVGIDHVGLGSDFDGSTTAGFDASQVIAVTQALLTIGFSDADIRKVMGGNVLQLLRAGIAPS